MALIKCPECGQDVSDKAEKCPHCGVSIVSMNDIVLCCPYCLSSRLDPVNKKFSASKAALGYICVGEIGMLAGASGIDKEEFTCRSCGNKFKGMESPRLREGEREEVKREYTRLITEVGAIESEKYIEGKMPVPLGGDYETLRCRFLNHNNLKAKWTMSDKRREVNRFSLYLSGIIACICLFFVFIGSLPFPMEFLASGLVFFAMYMIFRVIGTFIIGDKQ